MAKIIEVARPAFVNRAERFLDGIKDGTLLTLKAHLLLEEALFSAVCAKCINPEHIEKADLSFYRQLQIARALYAVPSDDEKKKTANDTFWDASEALNTLRNRLAHNLEPKSLGPILKRLYVRELGDGESLSDPEIFNQLSITVSILIGYAWGLGATAKKTAERGFQS